MRYCSTPLQRIATMCCAMFIGVAMASQANAGEVRRLLILDSQDGEPYKTARLSMLEELARQGYEETRNLQVTYHAIGNDKEKGIAILKEELPKKYNLVYVGGTIMAMAAKEVAFGPKESPILFGVVTDPVGLGLIENFEDSPKANFTGVCFPVPVRSRLKFILDVMPDVKTIGLIHSDMPQSISYRSWLEEVVGEDKEFSKLKLIYRLIPMIKGEDGSKHWADKARKVIEELDPQVDVFLSPNDQMGIMESFPRMVYEVATKPLVGVGREEVIKGWGATMSAFPSTTIAGRQLGVMAKKLLDGKPVSAIKPEWPRGNGVAFDLNKIEKFGLRVPVELIELAGDNIVHDKKPEKAIRIGVTWVGKSGMTNRVFKGLAEQLAFSAPQIEIECRGELPDIEALAKVAARFEREKVAMVILRSTGAEYLAEHRPAIPTFIGGCNNPVQLGTVSSMSEPEGNITGVTYALPYEAQFKAFKSILPDMETVLLIVEAGHPSSAIDQAGTRSVCKQLKIEYRERACKTKDEILAVVREAQGKVSAIILGNQALVFDDTTPTVAAAGMTPVLAYSATPVQEGVLCGLATDDRKLGRMLAESIVDVLINGKAISAIPVKVDPDPQLHIHLRTAKRISVPIPIRVLDKANVIR